MSLDASTEELLRRLVARYEPVQVWLFGSRARGDATEASDWDLLVVVPDDAPAERRPSLAELKERRDLDAGVSGLVIDLEDLLGCRVHVVREGGVRRREVRQRLHAEAVPL